jgi:hypothetical protein
VEFEDDAFAEVERLTGALPVFAEAALVVLAPALAAAHSIKGDITDEQFDWWNESGAKKLCIEKRRDAAAGPRDP